MATENQISALEWLAHPEKLVPKGVCAVFGEVEANPQLAGEDYIHFTPLGAKKIAKLLYDTLHLYYRFYLFRTGQENVELTAEDSAVVNFKQKEQEVQQE